MNAARDQFQTALEIKPVYAEALCNLGKCFSRKDTSRRQSADSKSSWKPDPACIKPISV